MESVCSICSKHSCECEVIDEATRELLEVVFIDIKITFGGDLHMCSVCKNKLIKCFEFKAKCIYTEDFIYPYIHAKNDDSKVDIGTIYLKRTGLKKRPANPESLKICRLCLERGDGRFYYITENTLRKYNIYETFFQKFLPEVNLNVTETPIMCDDCLTSLRSFAEFVSCHPPMAEEVSLSYTNNKENNGTATWSRINEPDVCKYCKQKKTNIRRHMESMHKNEADVKEYMLMGDDNPKKLELLAQIRRDGNFIVSGLSQEIILKKCSSSNQLKTSVTKNYSKSTKEILQHSKTISESIHVRANAIVRKFLFPVFQEGPVKEAIRFDELIILYANEMTSMNRSQHHFPIIRNKMIWMAKVLLNIKNSDESVQTFKDILKPQLFDKLIRVINCVGEYNEVTGNYGKPTEIGTLLKYMTNIYISECVKNNNMEEKSLGEDLLDLLQTSLPAHINKTSLPSHINKTSLPDYINKTSLPAHFNKTSLPSHINKTSLPAHVNKTSLPARVNETMPESLLTQKGKKIVGLPSMNDKIKLICYVLTQRNKYFNKLNVNFDSDSWINLSKYTFISALIFNKRRPSELEKILVSNFHTSTNIGEESEIFKQLKSSDQAHIREYVRFGIRKGVYVLLDKPMNECLKLLMKYRKDAGVVDNNPYLFALPQCRIECDEDIIIFRHLYVYNLMRQYSEACGAINPEALRATTFRKQVATKSMTYDSNNEEIQHLQCYLRHAEKIDLMYSRQPVSQQNILIVIKILLAAQDDLPGHANAATTSSDLAASPSFATTISDSLKSTSEYLSSSDDLTNEDLYGSKDIYAKTTPKRPRFLAVTPGHSVANRTWTIAEKQATRKIFAHYIKKKNLPTNLEISESIKNCPVLKNLTISHIKLWIYRGKKSLMSSLNPANNKRAPKRRINKSNVCKYCKKQKPNIRRHIESMHKNEADVKKYMLMRDDNPKKLKLLAQIRRDGNFIAFKGDRKIVLSRLASRNIYRNEVKYTACSKCKIIIKKRLLSNHLKTSCTKNYSKSAKGMLQRSKAISESIHFRANDILREVLFPAFKEGPLKEAIRFDELIILYANELSSKYRCKLQFPIIRKKMIRMAKVLLKIKSFDGSVQTLKDILKPKMFGILMKVIKCLGEYNEVTENYEKPTFLSEVGFSLKHMTKLFISECIKNNNIEDKSLAKDLLNLLETSLPDHVNKTTTESLLKQETEIDELPCTDDIIKLICYIVTERKKYFSKLNSNFNLDSWINLSNYTLISILIFDRRMPAELERSLVSNLDKTTNLTDMPEIEDCEYFKELSSPSQSCVREYERFYIGGGSFVLLDRSMKECLKLLIKYRKDAGVDKNPYLFALPQDGQECDEKIIFRHLHATPLLRQYSEACGVINPKTLRASSLKRCSSLELYIKYSGIVQEAYGRHFMSDPFYRDMKIVLALQGEKFGPPVPKRTWTFPEKQVAKRIFARYITAEKKLPTDSEISEAIEYCSELKHRTIPQIRSFIHNCKKTQPEFRAELNLKPEGRTPWNEEQASLVRSHFKENIISKRAPKKNECLQLIETYPEILHNKDWVRVKTFIYNIYRNQ